MEQEPLHIPDNAIQSVEPHEIICIIGGPGSGKTTSCLTFPNRIWYDFDHKLPKGELSFPFWDGAFCDKFAKRTMHATPNMRDAFKKHLKDNAGKYTEAQTVIFDSASKLLNGLDMQCDLERDAEGADSKKANWNFWDHKLRFWRETMTLTKSIKSRVIWIFHETQERDEEGRLTGKIKPILDGSYKDQILGDFTDVWRQLCNPPKRDANGMSIVVNGKKQYEQGWFWQLHSDTVVNTNTNPTLGAIVRKMGIKMVKADYNEIQKLYNLSQTQQT